MRKQYERPIILANKKQCTQCKNFKFFSDFHKYAKSPDGYKHFCKACVREYDQNEADATRVFPRKLNEHGEIHCRNCGEYFKENQMHSGLSYCIDCSPLLSRTRTLKKYNLSLESYHQLLEDQGFRCKICKGKDTSFRKRLSVDHDHSCCPGEGSCGKCIRGLLCHHCNAALGNVKDNVETLQKMIEYLN
jgi:hypothetical protein